MKLKTLLICAASVVAALLVVDAHQCSALTPPEDSPQIVFVFGQVITQGEIPWQSGLTVESAILHAGGFAQFANTRRIAVVSSWWRPSVYKVLINAIVTPVNALSGAVTEVWWDLDLPDILPDLELPTAETGCRAVVDARKSGGRFTLFPGDVLIVDELMVNF